MKLFRSFAVVALCICLAPMSACSSDDGGGGGGDDSDRPDAVGVDSTMDASSDIAIDTNDDGGGTRDVTDDGGGTPETGAPCPDSCTALSPTPSAAGCDLCAEDWCYAPSSGVADRYCTRHCSTDDDCADLDGEWRCNGFELCVDTTRE